MCIRDRSQRDSLFPAARSAVLRETEVQLLKHAHIPGASGSAGKNAVRGGTYSLAVAAVVLAILIAFNVVVSALPAARTQYDMSATKLYSVTSNTKVVVNALEENVTLYWVVQSGEEDAVVDVYKRQDSSSPMSADKMANGVFSS